MCRLGIPGKELVFGLQAEALFVGNLYTGRKSGNFLFDTG